MALFAGNLKRWFCKDDSNCKHNIFDIIIFIFRKVAQSNAASMIGTHKEMATGQ